MSFRIMDGFLVFIPDLRSVSLIIMILVTVTSSFLCGEIWGIALNSMRERDLCTLGYNRWEAAWNLRGDLTLEKLELDLSP